jgi:acyl-CoA thioesterase I
MKRLLKTITLIAGLGIFGACTLSSAQDNSPATSTEPVYIIPIGDSITQGGRRDDEYSWRYPLFKMLKDANVNFDFVGAYTKGLKGDFKWPDVDGVAFDTDHQGKYGIKTAKMRDRIKTDKDKWSHAPDIALIHLGTNDQKSEDYVKAVKEPLRDIIKMLRETNPNVVILLGHLNFTGGSAKKNIRPLVEELAKEENTEASPVITVNHYEGFNADPKHKDTDTYDWAHPNPKGQKKMAAKWLEAMKPYIPELKDK